MAMTKTIVCGASTPGIFPFGLLLFALPILIAQWFGVLGLGKVRRNAAWRFMVTGICCSALGGLTSAITTGLWFFAVTSASDPLSRGFFLIYAANGISGLGSLLFAIGFALHGLQAARTNQRISELEAIAAAQGEELNRHRVTYDSAS